MIPRNVFIAASRCITSPEEQALLTDQHRAVVDQVHLDAASMIDETLLMVIPSEDHIGTCSPAVGPLDARGTFMTPGACAPEA